MKELSDLSSPRTVERKLLEKEVQKQCVDWARARGYWARKFSSQSQRSVPDYLFARELILAKQLAERCTVLLSPSHGQLDPQQRAAPAS